MFFDMLTADVTMRNLVLDYRLLELDSTIKEYE